MFARGFIELPDPSPLRADGYGKVASGGFIGLTDPSTRVSSGYLTLKPDTRPLNQTLKPGEPLRFGRVDGDRRAGRITLTAMIGLRRYLWCPTLERTSP